MMGVIDIVNGEPAPDVSHLDLAGANAQRSTIQARLGQINVSDPKRRDDAFQAERRRLIATLAALDAHVRDLREREGEERKRRTFAGIGSPLHEAIVARLDPALVAELEADALRRQAEREARAAERGASKGAAPAPKPPPAPGSPPPSPLSLDPAGRRDGPEVIVLPRRASGGDQ